MIFWLVAAVMIAGVLWAIARPLLCADARAQPAAEQDLQVYKDQLSEVDRDLARGVLSAAEADSARLEVSRRILAADKRLQTRVASGQVSPALSRAVLGLVALGLVAGSLTLYLTLGSPGLQDRPLATRLAEQQARRDARPDQEAAEAEAQAGDLAPPVNGDIAADYLDLVEELRRAVAERPTDVQGHRLLALHEARLGNYVAARKAQSVVVAQLGAASTGEDYTALAEYMIFAANGYVSPDAEDTLVQALQRDPKNPRARYFSGLALAQNGRPDVAYRMWAGLLDEGPQDAPWIAPIRAQIATVARAAGIDISTLPGPSQQQVQEAEEMTPEARQEMIRSMVAGLAERLATEGGTPNEWARLIRAYGVLGELDKAALIWTEARETFASDAAAMKLLSEAAEELGIN